jgi:hypothetical protein
MRRVLSILVAFAFFPTLALAAPTLPVPKPAAPTIPGWVLSPSSRTAARSNDSATLSGVVFVPEQVVFISAIDQNTGQRVLVGTAKASKVPAKAYQSYTLYRWTYGPVVLDVRCLDEPGAPRALCLGSGAVSS